MKKWWPSAESRLCSHLNLKVTPRLHRRPFGLSHTFSQPDLQIAAIAALADLIVVSRDTSKFVVLDLPDADGPDGLADVVVLMWSNIIAGLNPELAGIKTAAPRW